MTDVSAYPSSLKTGTALNLGCLADLHVRGLIVRMLFEQAVMNLSDIPKIILRLLPYPALLLVLVLSEHLCVAGRSCPSQSVSKCFHKFFVTYRFMQWPTCQTFDYMEKCFKFAHCDVMELAHLCSVEYRKVHNNYIPKEAILAVHENLRQRCDPHCHRNSEEECTNRLFLAERARDRDQAIIMEIKALKKQLDLTMSPPSVACQQIHSALRRLQVNRRNVCSDSSVFCLCRRLLEDLPRACNFHCDQYRQRKNEDLRPAGSVVLIMASVFAVVVLYTERM